MPAETSTAKINIPWVDPMPLILGACGARAYRHVLKKSVYRVFAGCGKDQWLAFLRAVSPDIMIPKDMISVAVMQNPSNQHSPSCFIPVRLHELRVHLESSQVTFSDARDYGQLSLRRWHTDASNTPITVPTGVTVEVERISEYRIHSHSRKPGVVFFTGNTISNRQPPGIYLGYELESAYPSSEHVNSCLLGLFNLDYSLNQGDPFRMHVETDSSIGNNGLEIVTRPHAAGHASSYTFLKKMFRVIKAAGGHNNRNTCGMHVHMNRSAEPWLVYRSSSTPEARILDYLTAGYCLFAQQSSRRMMQMTGRSQRSTYSRTESSQQFCQHGGDRYRHINWSNEKTIEFRFPGPHNFDNPEWPCIVMDILVGLIETTNVLSGMYAAGGLSPLGRTFVETTARSQTMHIDSTIWYAVHALLTVMNDLEHKFLYGQPYLSGLALSGIIAEASPATENPTQRETSPLSERFSLLSGLYGDSPMMTTIELHMPRPSFANMGTTSGTVHRVASDGTSLRMNGEGRTEIGPALFVHGERVTTGTQREAMEAFRNRNPEQLSSTGNSGTIPGAGTTTTTVLQIPSEPTARPPSEWTAEALASLSDQQLSELSTDTVEDYERIGRTPLSRENERRYDALGSLRTRLGIEQQRRIRLRAAAGTEPITESYFTNPDQAVTRNSIRNASWDWLAHRLARLHAVATPLRTNNPQFDTYIARMREIAAEQERRHPAASTSNSIYTASTETQS